MRKKMWKDKSADCLSSSSHLDINQGITFAWRAQAHDNCQSKKCTQNKFYLYYVSTWMCVFIYKIQYQDEDKYKCRRDKIK